MDPRVLRGVAFIGFLIVFNVLSYYFHWGVRLW
jgi:hypothetical protein